MWNYCEGIGGSWYCWGHEYSEANYERAKSPIGNKNFFRRLYKYYFMFEEKKKATKLLFWFNWFLVEIGFTTTTLLSLPYFLFSLVKKPNFFT